MPRVVIFDRIVHAHRDLADDTVHLDESEEGAIHQHTRNHRDDTRDGSFSPSSTTEGRDGYYK